MKYKTEKYVLRCRLALVAALVIGTNNAFSDIKEADINREKIAANVTSMPVKKITGIITDTNGEPIIGANVMIKGTTKGVITDIDGKFSIDTATGDVLNISFIGYVSQEIKIGTSSTLKIILREDAQALDEVVVIGYGTTKRQDFTGAVSSVRLENSPIALTSNMNAMESLKGNVAGLDVGATNSAGGSPSLQLRGQKSISGSNSPLIVLDGVIYMGSIND